MQILLNVLRWLAARVSIVVVAAALAGRVLRAWRRRGDDAAERRRAVRELLPSLYDAYPGATTAPRRRIGLRSVPLDRVVGTLRHPSQNTADFLPLPRLRGQNWRARWQRINRAMDRLVPLPPVDLVQVGDDYYVEDGHNRVAAARAAAAVEIDADVTQLILPGVDVPSAHLDASTLIGNAEVREAAAGRHSRTVERRSATDEVSRRDLLRHDEEHG